MDKYFFGIPMDFVMGASYWENENMHCLKLNYSGCKFGERREEKVDHRTS